MSPEKRIVQMLDAIQNIPEKSVVWNIQSPFAWVSLPLAPPVITNNAWRLM